MAFWFHHLNVPTSLPHTYTKIKQNSYKVQSKNFLSPEVGTDHTLIYFGDIFSIPVSIYAGMYLYIHTYFVVYMYSYT